MISSFLFYTKYKYDNLYPLELTPKDKKTFLYQKIEESNTICFIGDSITNGYKNGYNPWYLPLMSHFDKKIINISKESYTTEEIISDFGEQIKESGCDLSIINIGTNDIRYYKRNVDDYIENIETIVELTPGEDVLLAPWQTTKNDYNISKDDIEKRDLYSIIFLCGITR